MGRRIASWSWILAVLVLGAGSPVRPATPERAARPEDRALARPRLDRGRLIVKFKQAMPAGSLAKSGPVGARSIRRMFAQTLDLAPPSRSNRSALRQRRGVGSPPADLRDTYVLEFDDESLARRAAAAYEKDPDVAYVQPDFVHQASFVPNDPYFASAGSWGQPYGDLWALGKMNLSAAWDTTRGEGAVVAVVDSGIDYNHPDLAANVWTNAAEIPANGIDDDGNGYVDDVRGWDFANGDADPMDRHGHGTHVAGTIAAVGDNGIGVIGVAPAAHVMAVKGLDDTGSGYTSRLAEAIVYAADNGADVINNSWGCSSRCPSDPAIEEAVRYAGSRGAVVVFAAGNSHDDVVFYSPQNMTGPKPVVVAATNPSDQAASFSNFGALVDVSAPGAGPETGSSAQPSRGILSLKSAQCDPSMCDPGLIVGGSYLRQAGTSMAAPQVSGALALIVSANPTLTVADLRRRLLGNSTDLGVAGDDTTFGAGRIDALAALQDVAPFALAEITAPTPSQLFGQGISIWGTAAARDFASYSVEVGLGASPSTWTSNGIVLAGGQPVDGALASWNTQGYAAGLWTIRLVVSSPSGAREYRTPVSVDNALLEGWPRATLGGPGSYQQAVVVADLDGDGTKEVIAGSYYGLLYAWHADGTLVSGFPVEAASYGGETLTPAVGDLDGDGTMEIVVGSDGLHSGGLSADLFVFEADGTARPGWPRISANYISDPPTLADIDGDGTLEILTGEEDWQVHAYHHDGTPVAGWPVRVDHGQNVSGISVGDLDGDGTMEVLAGHDGYVYAWHARDLDGDGRADRVAGWPVAVTPPTPGFNETIFVAPALADLDLDGTLEVLATSGMKTYFGYDYQVFAWNAAGQVMPGWPRIVAGTVQWSSVAVGDLDNDYRPDVVVSGEDGSVWAWSGEGAVLPGFPVNVGGSDISRGHSAVLADVDGDGFNDIVSGVGSGIAVVDHTGAVKPGWPKLVDVDSVPALGDLDGDGRLEVAAYGKDGKVYVWAVEGASGEGKMAWPMLGQNASHTGRSLNRRRSPMPGRTAPSISARPSCSMGPPPSIPMGERCPTNGAMPGGRCWPPRPRSR